MASNEEMASLPVREKETSSQVQELSPESLLTVVSPSGLNVSASGKYVVYATATLAVSGEHPVSAIHLATVAEEGSSRQLTSGLFNDKSPCFSPDGSTVAFISDRAKAGESSAIYLISASGPGEAYAITSTENKKSIESLQWSPCGKFIAYTSSDEKTPEQERREKDKEDWKIYGEDWEFSRLRVIHVGTKEITTLESGDLTVAHFSWADTTKDGLVYTTTKTTDPDSAAEYGMDFWSVTIGGSQGKTKITHFPGTIMQIVYVDQHVYFRAGWTPASSCTSHIIYRMLNKGEDSEWERYAFGEDRCATGLLKAGGKVYGSVQHGLKDEIHDIASFRIVFETLNDIPAWGVASTPSGLVVVINKSSVQSPPEVYSTTSETSGLCKLSGHNSAILSGDIGTYKSLLTTTTDGLPVDGVLILPTNTTSKPLPLLVLVHGGPYSRSTVDWDPSYFGWAPHLVSAGYAILQVNYRGGSSHGESYAAANRGKVGTKEYDDIMTLLRYTLKTQSDMLDASRVGIGGWSNGGFLSYVSTIRGTLAGAEAAINGTPKTEKPDAPFHFKAAICGAGITDWDMMSMGADLELLPAELAGLAPWTGSLADTVTRRGSPIWEMGEAAAAAKEARVKTGVNMMTPTLVLHGASDSRVPLPQAWAFQRGCKLHGWPYEMVVYPREPHVFSEKAHLLDMIKRVRKFCDLHI